MICLGIDPGPDQSGAAFVEVPALGPLRLLRAELFPSTARGADALLCNAFDLLAIEMPEGMIFAPYRGPGVIATARKAGGIEFVAELKGIAVAAHPASWVRGELCRKANASDRVVALVVEDLLRHPEVATNKHTRDAAAVAIAEGFKATGVKRKLSPAAELALIRLLAEESAKRTEKRRKKAAAKKAAEGATDGR